MWVVELCSSCSFTPLSLVGVLLDFNVGLSGGKGRESGVKGHPPEFYREGIL